MSSHSKVVARTDTDRQTHRDTDTTKTLPLPHAREVKSTQDELSHHDLYSLIYGYSSFCYAYEPEYLEICVTLIVYDILTLRLRFVNCQKAK